MAAPFQFLVVGHVTRDLLAEGASRPGGTALYAAVTMARLGYRVAVYTAAGPDLDLSVLEGEGVTVVCRPSVSSTTFCNRYAGNRRRQMLLGRAAPLPPTGRPGGWSDIPAVLLGPVVGEVGPEWVEAFPRATVGACLQGWLRAWDAAGRVRPAPWAEAARWLPRFSAAFLSLEDVGGEGSWVEEYAAHCPRLILTAGAAGAILYEQRRPVTIAAFPVREVDPTGAGDVFAAAFLVRQAEGATPEMAARFAAAAAALSVQGEGIAAIPTRPAVEALLREAGYGLPAA